jgi:hypothetical protein
LELLHRFPIGARCAFVQLSPTLSLPHSLIRSFILIKSRSRARIMSLFEKIFGVARCEVGLSSLFRNTQDWQRLRPHFNTLGSLI